MSFNISPNSPYHTASSQPVFQEESSPLMKRRRIMGEEETPQSSAEMIEFSDGENPMSLEMTESVLDTEEEVRPTHSTRKRRRVLMPAPLSESQMAILSIFEKTSQCIAAGTLKKEEGSTQEKSRKPGYQQHRWDALLKGFAIGASPEDQMIAAYALFPLTQESLNWCKAKLVSKPKETAGDGTIRHRWEAIDLAITPGASIDDRREGIQKLQALLKARESVRKSDARKREARIPENLFSYTTPKSSSLLLIIEKTSRYIDDKHVWDRSQSYDTKIQAPRWAALLQGVREKATEEEQEEAAKNLASLIQDIQPRYIQGRIQEYAAKKPRIQWNAVSEGVRHNASEIIKQEAVKHLETILGNYVTTSKGHTKKEDLTKDQNLSTFLSTPSFGQFPEEWLLSPLSEFTVNAEAPQSQTEQSNYSNFADLSHEQEMLRTNLTPNTPARKELLQNQATEFETRDTAQEAPEGTLEISHGLPNPLVHSQSEEFEQTDSPDSVDPDIFLPRAMLSIIEKTSECIERGLLKREENSIQHNRVKKPQWDALLKGFTVEASHEDQMQAANALFSLTQSFLKQLKERVARKQNESSQNGTYRRRWEAIDRAITPGASIEERSNAVQKLQALLAMRKTQEESYNKQKAIKIQKKPVCNTSSPPSPLLLIIEKASQYILNTHIWSSKRSNNTRIQNPRWTAILNGEKEKATEDEQEEAAKSLAALTQDMQPRYIQENIKETSVNQKRKIQWNAVREGIQFNASEITKQEAAKHLDAILREHEKRSKPKNENAAPAKHQDQVVNPASSFLPTPQSSALFTEEWLLSPYQMIEQTPSRGVEQEIPDDWFLSQETAAGPFEEQLPELQMTDWLDSGTFLDDLELDPFNMLPDA